MLDSGIATASHFLQTGRPLKALASIGLRRDAHAAAIRGIALAQLGEFERARASLSKALRQFRRSREPLWIVKTQAALAEIAWAERDLVGAVRRLDSSPLRELGDAASAAYVDLQRARLLALMGRAEAAETLLRSVGWGPAAVLARAELLAFRGRFGEATRICGRFRVDNPLLEGEAHRLGAELTRPAFLFRRAGRERRVSLIEIERLRGPFLDAIRKRWGAVDLSRRPAQFELMLALARGPVTAERLYPGANESHRARLKMEVSRLRRATGLRIRATPRGFEMETIDVLRPGADPIEGLLADGETWPPRAIAATLGLTVRSVERALEGSPHVLAVGRGRSRRYRLRRPAPGIATQLLLLSSPPARYKSQRKGETKNES